MMKTNLNENDNYNFDSIALFSRIIGNRCFVSTDFPEEKKKPVYIKAVIAVSVIVGVILVVVGAFLYYRKKHQRRVGVYY